MEPKLLIRNLQNLEEYFDAGPNPRWTSLVNATRFDSEKEIELTAGCFGLRFFEIVEAFE